MEGTKEICDFVSRFRECNRLSPESSVWRLQAVSCRRIKTVEEAKKHILRLAVHGHQNLILSYTEDPTADGVQGRWKSLAAGLWIIPSEADISSLYEWLRLGNWTLYGVEKEPDVAVWRCPTGVAPEQVLRSMVSHEILFCIDSFHDNDPWLIFINPCAVAA